MSIELFLNDAVRQLKAADIESARLDCLILLEDATGKDRSWLLAHPELVLHTSQLHYLQKSLARRASQEPLAYIRGRAAFYGREFYVNSNVLIPRPETEAFIDLLKTIHLHTKYTRILDVGCGSGCIGITASLEFPDSKVVISDIDAAALTTARKNAAFLQADVSFVQSNLLNTISTQSDVIVANLPYVPDKLPVKPPVLFEPALALYAGSDGMDLYRDFWSQVKSTVQKPRFVLTESLVEQHTTQTTLAAFAGYQLQAADGLVQLFAQEEVSTP